MTEDDELVEETETFLSQGSQGLVKLLNERIDTLKAGINFDALRLARQERRDAISGYLERLEKKYYAALAARDKERAEERYQAGRMRTP